MTKYKRFMAAALHLRDYRKCRNWPPVEDRTRQAARRKGAMREPRISQAELAVLHGVVVAPGGVTHTGLAGCTLLMLTQAQAAGGDHLDIAELDLPAQRVINLGHLVLWAIGQGY
jgi:hypothetical protein